VRHKGLLDFAIYVATYWFFEVSENAQYVTDGDGIVAKAKDRVLVFVERLMSSAPKEGFSADEMAPLMLWKVAQ
jgi:hypothetical protein